jgi:hypothetical protein
VEKQAYRFTPIKLSLRDEQQGHAVAPTNAASRQERSSGAL